MRVVIDAIGCLGVFAFLLAFVLFTAAYVSGDESTSIAFIILGVACCIVGTVLFVTHSYMEDSYDE